jgi:predicted ATPase
LLREEALEVAHRNGERYYEAELHRIKGELFLIRAAGRGLSRAAAGGKAVFQPESPGVAAAEASFHQSIQVARQQEAKSWELRAAMGLARLHRNQGKEEEGRALLAQIYDRFAEGFGTLDLREAKALLESRKKRVARQSVPGRPRGSR